MNNTERNHNRMLGTLKKIARGYMTPAQLARECKQGSAMFGYGEMLEMSYENIQAEARTAVRGVREVVVGK